MAAKRRLPPTAAKRADRQSRDDTFARKLLAWWETQGRHDLPWQRKRNAYRVWVSEVMLQQTQVTTVIPYFERFMQAFPTLHTLADASLDTVLHLWTGLGYYSRARNLHAAAQRLAALRILPRDVASWQMLPGIGRSTAAAIVAQAFGTRAAILDGNVKRVLARWHGIRGWPGDALIEQTLWELADALTPHERIADYTQAIMDLGATVCVRQRPQCGACPAAATCVAHRDKSTDQLPYPRPKRIRPQRAVHAWVVVDSTGDWLLERRPPHGIWGGLFSFIETSAPPTIAEVESHLLQTFGARYAFERTETLPPLKHTFTHFDLLVTPICFRLPSPFAAAASRLSDGERWLWYRPDRDQVGLTQLVTRVIARLAERATDVQKTLEFGVAP